MSAALFRRTLSLTLVLLAALGVQRGEQSGAAGPEDQDVGVMSVNLCVHPQNALDRLKEENAGQEC